MPQQTEHDPHDVCFAGAFSESYLERMEDSPFVQVVDKHGMGSMSEHDWYVSYRIVPGGQR